MIGFQLALPLVCLAAGGLQALLLYAAALAAAAAHGAAADPAPAGDLRARRHHRPQLAADRGAHQPHLGQRCQPARRAAALFPHHVNYHLEHHLYPAVPHYHLPRLHRLLRDKGALDGAEVRDLDQTLALVFAARRPRDAALAAGH